MRGRQITFGSPLARACDGTYDLHDDGGDRVRDDPPVGCRFKIASIVDIAAAERIIIVPWVCK